MGFLPIPCLLSSSSTSSESKDLVLSLGEKEGNCCNAAPPPPSGSDNRAYVPSAAAPWGAEACQAWQASAPQGAAADGTYARLSLPDGGGGAALQQLPSFSPRERTRSFDSDEVDEDESKQGMGRNPMSGL